MTPAGARKRRGPHRETPLQKWLDDHRVPAGRVEATLRERLHGRAPSRQQFGRWRLGRVDIRRKDMVRVLWAVRQITGDADLRIEELFDLDPEHDHNWDD